MGPIAVGVKKKWGIDLIGLEKTHNRFALDWAGPNATQATRAQAVGRLATGWGATGLAMRLAGSGDLTGRGPSDPGQRAALMNAGWQPYSIVRDGKYYSYQRFAPFSMFLGLAADFTDAFRLAGPEEQDTTTMAFYGLMTGVAQNLTEQTYMVGLKNLLDMVSDPTMDGVAVARRMFGSTVPSGVSQLVPLEDDSLRDVRSFADAWMSRIPGLSDNLAPKRNVLGEPILRTKALGQDEIGTIQKIWMPVAYSETTSDQISLEMARLQHGFQPPGVRKGGIRLLEHRNSQGQTAYDRWQELQGRVRLRGRTIRAELGRLMSSRDYQLQPLEGTPDQESPRVGLVRNVISRYRREAWKQLLREFPQLDAAVSAVKMKRRNPYAIPL